jgi:hypothetical protein
MKARAFPQKAWPSTFEEGEWFPQGRIAVKTLIRFLFFRVRARSFRKGIGTKMKLLRL